MTALTADRFRPGDHVIGEDDGERLFGLVSRHHGERNASDGDVLVFWSGEEYDEGSNGHLVPAGLLRLWPAAAHAGRLAEGLRGADGEGTEA